MSERETIRFGPFEFDLRCEELRKDGARLKLQGQPIQILELLLSKRGELVSREEIRQRLWSGDTFVDFEHSLNTAIKKLRQALGDEAVEPRYIETLPKRGYRFVGRIENQDALLPSPTMDPATIPGFSGIHRLSAQATFWISLGLLAILAAAVFVAQRVFRPLPLPQIVGVHVLTHTGYAKTDLVSDGRMLYFREDRPAGPTIVAVPITGGEAREIVRVSDSARLSVRSDGSELLINILNRDEGRWDAWIQPLPNGPGRLAIKDALDPMWSPDGQHIVFSRNSRRREYQDLLEANADGTDIRFVVRIPISMESAISPDGRLVYLRHSSTATIWEAGMDGSEPHPVKTIERGAHVGAWSPDGEYYFYRGFGPGTGNPSVLHVIAGDRNWRGTPRFHSGLLSSSPLTLGSPVVSSDGKTVFVNTVLRRGELAVLDRKSGRFVPYVLPLSACYTGFSPDGQWIAYVSYPDATLWRSKVDGSERRQLTSAPIRPLLPRWSPDGKLILFGDFFNAPSAETGLPRYNIYAVSPEGGEPLLLLAGNPVVSDGSWSPDGSKILYMTGVTAFGGLSIHTFDIKSGESVELPASKGLYSPRWSPDGTYILALSFPATRLMLYTISTRQWQQIASNTSGWFGWPNWTRDSKYIQLWEEGRVVRFNVATHKKELVADMGNIPTVDIHFDAWLGITPDGLPITTRDTGSQEISAFDLVYK